MRHGHLSWDGSKSVRLGDSEKNFSCRPRRGFSKSPPLWIEGRLSGCELHQECEKVLNINNPLGNANSTSSLLEWLSKNR